MKWTRFPGGLTIEIASEDDTARLGRALAEVVRPGVVIGLSGPLGAGKTRLVQAFAEAMDVDPGEVTSPTFQLIHEYEGRLPIYHVDAYRLNGPRAFEDLGVTDYWAGSGVCLVEWADRVRGLLPADSWMIHLEPTGPTSREVRLEVPVALGEVADQLAVLLS
jgi:tRNA threonylcarbamoyladenosine biosynthesis protein TsaE